ncbi:MAG: sugar ABC transporter permease [Clostridia bacterium]|nr:sugar ABC transporter permease [Clostridia bacterium]
MMTVPNVRFTSRRWKNIWIRVVRNKGLYLLVLPLVVYFGVFYYAPLYGLQIAFKNFKPVLGILGSPWVGLKHINKFLNSFSFESLLRNTLTLSVYGLVVNFPLAIMLAIIIHYIPNLKYKKVVQTATYAPYFVSTVVLVGMLFIFFAPESGMVNKVVVWMGGKAKDYVGSADLFPHVYVWSGVWQRVGWNSIIYIAALTSVSPDLHEAATVDGASKLQRIWHVDFPAIIPTAVIMLIMDCGRIMSLGYEKIYLMQTSSNLLTSEVISTYVYKIGLQNAQYSYAAAIGFFNNAINCILLVVVNKIANKLSGSGLW